VTTEYGLGIDIGGTPARPVVATPDREMDPGWASDDDWCAVVRGDLGHPRVVISRRDGVMADCP
jgi:hypothetical protein